MADPPDSGWMEVDYSSRSYRTVNRWIAVDRLCRTIDRRWQAVTYLYFPRGYLMCRRLNPMWLRFDEWRHGPPRTPPIVPLVGQHVYVSSAYYIGDGENDRRGGWATIRTVNFTHGSYWITLLEFPETHSWNYRNMLADQRDLRLKFAWRRARPDPDPREEFNSSAWRW